VWEGLQAFWDVVDMDIAEPSRMDCGDLVSDTEALSKPEVNKSFLYVRSLREALAVF